MTNHWLARFSDEPALVAPGHKDRFEAALHALDAATLGNNVQLQDALSFKSGSPDAFWTELGEWGSKRLRPYVVSDNGTLIIPVKGVLLHDFPYQYFSYATGYEYIWRAFERGLSDENVKRIALLIESPGGEVAGTFDLVDRIYAARGSKPVRAFAHEFAYSAAYSIASAADDIVVSRTGGVGSIGVVTAHVDFSKALEADGVKVTFIYAGAHKVDGNAYEALPAAVKLRIQQRIDTLYAVFVDTVARNRNLDAAAVRATEALTYTADEAIEVGLADSKGALDAAMAEFEADADNPQEGEETMTTLTVASVKADHADIANALIEEGKTLGKAEAKTEFDTQMTTERSRVASLDKLAAQFGSSTSVTTIIAAAKADGSSAADTSLKLIDAGAHKPAAAVEGLLSDEEKAKAATPAAPGSTAAKASTPDGWKAEYAADAKLQTEFPSAEAYVAFKKDEAKKGASN